MIDHAQESRAAFIATGAVNSGLCDPHNGHGACDPYAQKRADAIEWLREHNLYVLDAGSRHYTPAHPRGPQAMVELRTAL